MHYLDHILNLHKSFDVKRVGKDPPKSDGLVLLLNVSISRLGWIRPRLRLEVAMG
jgi:hypothetical protein